MFTDEVGVESLSKHGTNSTIFTNCCGCAICDDQSSCPGCGKKVIGSDVGSAHERGMIRWRSATAHWKR